MRPENYEQLLDHAAELWGIVPEFWDIWGRKHITAPETKRAILESLGLRAGSAEELGRELDEHARREAARLLPACTVVSSHGPLAVAARTAGPAHFRIRLEGGVVREFDAPAGAVELPFEVPLGYHEIEVESGGRRESAPLIVTPDRAFTPEGRAAGLSVPLYGLRSSRNWGCGDFTDLEALAEWAAEELGASFIGLNPLHAIPNRRPFNTSPYLPNTIFYQNFIYLDVERIEDFARSPRTQRAWRQCGAAEAAALRATEFVEYERVAALKLRFLKLAFVEFRRRGGSPDFESFVTREGDLLERFATWSALDEHIRRRHPDVWIWPDWPPEFRHPDSAAVAAFRERHRRSIEFWKYVQWQIDRQLAHAHEHARSHGMPIGLYHDLALATDRFGSDFWAHREYFASGCRVGSPPDDFSPKGQDWGFPPPCSECNYNSGYRLFAESIRKNCRHGGALRIDHVMRFFRLYWIPDGCDASRGTYVRDRHEDLIRILALESVRNRVIVVGEDLGTVEPLFREILTRFGILSYRLLYFEKDQRDEFCPNSEYPEQALVSATTHDLPTLAGFWAGTDIEARQRAGGFASSEQYRAAIAARMREKQKMLDRLRALGFLPASYPGDAGLLPELTGEIHNAVIGFLALAPSLLLCINQEDLTKETEQQNLPATTSQYPNWGRKMKYTLEELRTEELPRDTTAMIRNWLEKSGRRMPLRS